MLAAAPRIGVIVAGAATVVTLLFTGYTLGLGELNEARAEAEEDGYARGLGAVRLEHEGAARTVELLLGILRAPAVARGLPDGLRDDLDRASEAAAAGDYSTAAAALPDNLLDVAQPDCIASGVTFAAHAGTLVRNCETGMTAVVATVNSNGTIGVTAGDRLRSGAPGATFADTRGRYPHCLLIYQNLAADTDPMAARMNFDCVE